MWQVRVCWKQVGAGTEIIQRIGEENGTENEYESEWKVYCLKVEADFFFFLMVKLETDETEMSWITASSLSQFLLCNPAESFH